MRPEVGGEVGRRGSSGVASVRADTVTSCGRRATGPTARRGGASSTIDVGVGAAGAEAGDAGDARAARPGLPRAQLGVDEERAVREVGLRVGLLEVEAGRDLAVLQRQHRLDERGDAGGLAGVADVRLQRTDRAELPVVGAAAVRLGERR